MFKSILRSKKTTFYSFLVPTVFFAMALSLPGCKETEPVKEITLEVWGVFDDSDLYKELINKYEEAHPETNIVYKKKTYETYENDLLETMASDRGPDIFMIYNNWIPRYLDKIKPAKSEIVSNVDVKKNFVDVVYEDFVSEDSVLALPLFVDTLALYYNKDIFNTLTIAEPPETWKEFLEAVRKISITDEKGEIVRAGAAMGTAKNVNRSVDILSLLMLQNQTPMVNKDKGKAIFDEVVRTKNESYYPGRNALEFYTNFANPLSSVYTWNKKQHYSLDSFYEGETAMMFNYSYHIPTIRAKSPYLNFDVALMPQPEEAEKAINYAHYWGLTVSRNAKSVDGSWGFIKWLTSQENAKTYLEKADRPTARRDLVDWQKKDIDVGVFAEQSLSAHSWYQENNRLIETYFADMIESVVVGNATIGDAINKAADQVSLIMGN